MCSTTEIPGLHFSLNDHYSCFFTWEREVSESTDLSSFHMAQKTATDEEDQTRIVIQQNPFPSEKESKAPLYSIYAVKHTFFFCEGIKTVKWMALFLSMCMPSYPFFDSA